MKIEQIFEADDNVDYSFVSRRQLQQAEQNRADKRKQINQWFEEHIYPLIIKFYQQRVFGFRSVEEMKEFIDREIYTGMVDEIVYHGTQEEFKDHIQWAEEDVVRKAELIAKSAGPLLAISKEIEHKLAQWFELFKHPKYRSYWALVRSLPNDKNVDVQNWRQLTQMLRFMKEHFKLLDRK